MGRSTTCIGGRCSRAEARAAAASVEDFSKDSRMPLNASSSRSQVTKPVKSGAAAGSLLLLLLLFLATSSMRSRSEA